MTCSVSGQYRSAYPKSIFCDKTAFPTVSRSRWSRERRSPPTRYSFRSRRKASTWWYCRTFWKATTNPHDVLREVERVLMPEGQVVISGFNTASLWRVRQAFAPRHNGAPWDAKFIGLLRLREWLRVLGFELNGGKFGCYAPPFRNEVWLKRFAFMDKAGARWWPVTGGVYVVRAVKRVHGMRIVTPAWRQERARRRALAPVSQRSHRNHHHE